MKKMKNQTEPKLEHYLSMVEGMRTHKTKLRKNIFHLLNEIYEIKNREEDEINKYKKYIYQLKESIKLLELNVKSKNDELVKLQTEIDSYEVIDEITEEDIRKQKKGKKFNVYMILFVFFGMVVYTSLIM